MKSFMLERRKPGEARINDKNQPCLDMPHVGRLRKRWVHTQMLDYTCNKIEAPDEEWWRGLFANDVRKKLILRFLNQLFQIFKSI